MPLEIQHTSLAPFATRLREPAGLFALEIKSGRTRSTVSGLDAFRASFPAVRLLVVGTAGITLEHWSTTGTP